VGFIVFFVTFFGCCGAIKENHCMTATFTVLLVTIQSSKLNKCFQFLFPNCFCAFEKVFLFLLELGAGIAAYMLRSEVTY